MAKNLIRKIDGLEVVDTNMALVVNVTKKDIANGKKRDPNNCAAAVAICRTYKAKQARVQLSRTYVEQKGKYHRYGTPMSLRTNIALFDKGGPFEPGEHILRPMPISQRLGVGQRGTKNGQNHKGGKKRVMHYLSGVRVSAPRGVSQTQG
jgi:hypothetical protein